MQTRINWHHSLFSLSAEDGRLILSSNSDIDISARQNLEFVASDIVLKAHTVSHCQYRLWFFHFFSFLLDSSAERTYLFWKIAIFWSHEKSDRWSKFSIVFCLHLRERSCIRCYWLPSTCFRLSGIIILIKINSSIFLRVLLSFFLAYWLNFFFFF